MKQLSIEEQRKMVQMGVTCSSTQLLRTGIVHADPHEGNMLYTDDGRLAMLDFGLMCRVDNDKQVTPHDQH
jgi:aarF domain-containing kinase